MSDAPLRRNRNFRLLWIGQVLSDTGSNAAVLAYPLLILALTHSAVIAGAVGTAGALAQLVLRLPAGALSDRWNRRTTLLIVESARTVILAVLAGLVLTHHVTWPVVLIVAVLDDAGGVIFSPAAMATLPAIVSSAQLETAWASTEARTYAASLAGPALGGSLFSVSRALPFVGDAISYGISVGTVALMSGEFQPDPSAERRALRHEIADGLRFVWRSTLLRAVSVQAPLINFAFTGVIFTLTLALRQYGTSAAVIGGLQAAIALGGLAGAVVATKIAGRFTLSSLVLGITTVGTGAFVISALLIPSPLVALPIALILAAAPSANASLFATMLRATPSELVGRVTSTVMTAAQGLASLAPLSAGLLVAHLSGHWAMGVFALALAVAAVLAICLPGLRDAEAEGTATGAPAASGDAQPGDGPTSSDGPGG